MKEKTLKSEKIKLILDDSRRLTGKSLLWDKPGAIIDVFVSGVDKNQVVERWLSCVQQLFNDVDWQTESSCYRVFEDGVSLAISAPLDALYAACELNEAAFQLTQNYLMAKQENEDYSFNNNEEYQAIVAQLKQIIADEVNPSLMHLIAMAKFNNTPYLVDDDEFSLGYGSTVQCWNINALPDPNNINWSQYHNIPLALVTGTNGKSTSVRIMSEIFKAAGKCCGVTSTDFIRVGDNIIDHGDYSGPSGARMLLRHQDAQVAILEVARGGILRRGLPIDHADAALITNVAEDHLGQYGINSVTALAQAKAVVAKALTKGTLVLNADDANLVALAPTLSATICWFSLSENNQILTHHKSQGGAICFVRQQMLIYCDLLGHESKIISVNDIPMTFNGAAKHNILNALGAIALAKSLDVSNNAITSALQSFSSNVDENPGRGNQFEIGNAKVIMDFAHNVHSMEAMVSTAENMTATHKLIMISHAGDRSDQEIINMTKSALKLKPALIVAAEIKEYLRCRKLGEISALITKTAIASGMEPNKVMFADDPCDGTNKIIAQLKEGDLALLMVLSDRDKVVELLKKQATK